MSTDPKFNFTPYDDNVVIKRMDIKPIVEKKAAKSNIIVPEGTHSPKNIMELEKQKTDQLATYELAEVELLKKWDEHMNQAVVIAVGPGRFIEEGVKIPIAAKPGDRVYVRGMVGEPIIINKQVYWIVKSHDLFGKVPKE